MNSEATYAYFALPEAALDLMTLASIVNAFCQQGLSPETRIGIERDVMFGQVPRLTFNELPPLPVIDGEIIAD